MRTNSRNTRNALIQCDHPIQGLQLIRKMKRAGQPIPKTLILNGPQCQHTLERMLFRLQTLLGEGSPELVVVQD